ncbi:MAG: TIR domain-containing protein [Lewinellaceae bacterium]|nr:TIR domain-containing protein [Lewinellaceae bacterium]
MQIKAIEKHLGFQLEEQPDLEALMKYRSRNTFARDGQGNVTGLNLRSNELTDKQLAFLKDATHLQALNLSENALTELRFPAELSTLRFLDLSENAGLRQLELPTIHTLALEWLDLNECALERFSLPSLLWLRKLDISRNKLRELIIGHCPALVMLDASGNQLSAFELKGTYNALKYLYLNDNQIETLRFIDPLTALEILHLRNNKLETLPDLAAYDSMEALYLHGNPLKALPKELIAEDESASSWEKVRDYQLNLEKGEIVNDRVKIIIVGNGRVGKTSMFKRLKGEKFDENEAYTHGVTLGELTRQDLPGIETGSLNAGVWDFGGQEIFYATHQFFLSDDALYILAWTAPQNVEAHRKKYPDDKWRSCEYWLDSIRRYGPKSPILMVHTHSDGKRDSIKTEYQEAPFEAECLYFSAKKDFGLPELKELLAQKLNSSIPFLGEKFPRNYESVIADIERLRVEMPVIPRPRFDEICKTSRIVAGTEDSVLDFLRRSGVVVYFDKDRLRDVIYIDPNWLTAEVYRLIGDELRDHKKENALRGRKGIIDEAWLQKTLPDHKPEDRLRLLELLRNFELIFEDSDTPGVWVSPQYLPRAPKKGENGLYDIFMDDVSLAFRFRFSTYMPDNLMINFLSRYGPFSRKQYWQDAICFTNAEKVKCSVVKEDENTLAVATDDSAPGLSLQKEICEAFRELGKNAKTEIAVAGGPFVAWETLAADVADDRQKTRALDGSAVPVKPFLHLFGSEHLSAGPKMKEKSSPAIFFSYAWGDGEETGESREKVVDDLFGSLLKDDFDVRRDKKDVGYGELISDFMSEIGRGDLIVVFVSDKYVRSPYCMFELYEIARNCKFEKDLFSSRILPVRVESIRFDDPDMLEQYFSYWESEEQKWENLIRKRTKNITPAQSRRYHITKDINQNFGELVDWLTDMNAKTNAILRENDFAEVKAAILNRLENLKK